MCSCFLLQGIFPTQGSNPGLLHCRQILYKLSLKGSPLIEEAIFSPLYFLASFVKDRVPISVWVYLWAFYLVPLVYISVFVLVPYNLDDCSFVV